MERTRCQDNQGDNRRSERRHGCEGGSAKISIAVGQCSIRAVSLILILFLPCIVDCVFLSEKVGSLVQQLQIENSGIERAQNELSFFRLKKKVAMNALKKVFTKDGRCMVLSTRPNR